MKHMKKLVVLTLIVVSMLAIAVPAMALSGVVDTSYGSTPGGTVNYYSWYSSSVSTSNLVKIGEKNNETALTVTSMNAHWYRFTQDGYYRYVLRQFVRVSGREWEIRYGTMELNLGWSWTRYVIQLQTDLAALDYYDGEIDGGYGSITEAAVMEFQDDHGLDDDGRCGPLTKAALYIAIN